MGDLGLQHGGSDGVGLVVGGVAYGRGEGRASRILVVRS
jgi:hypothetical protein